MSDSLRQTVAVAATKPLRPRKSLLVHWLASRFRQPKVSPKWQPAEVAEGQVAIGYVGHNSSMICYHNCRILTDPLLTTRVRGLQRRRTSGVENNLLQETDLVLVSSLAFDAAHRKSLKQISRKATVVLPPGGGRITHKLGFARVCELEVGQTIGFRGVEIACTAAKCHPKLAAMSFVIRGEGPSVFFCGQSGYFSGFGTVGAHYNPDIALLPIGGYAPAGLAEYNMDPEQAVTAFRDLGARLLIPVRHSVLPISYEHLDEPRTRLRRLVRRRNLENYVDLLMPGYGKLLGTQHTLPRTETEPHVLGKHLRLRAKGSVPPPYSSKSRPGHPQYRS